MAGDGAAGSGNVTVHVGSDGVLLVDSGIDRSAPQLVAAVQKLSTGRVRYIINTHVHPDHVGGNPAFARLAGADPADAIKIIGQQNVLNRLTHTAGDSIVLFRGSDVISAGDVFTPGAYPFIDLERGGSVQGEIAALNHILDLAVPARTQEGGTYIVPGHGRICDEADLVEFRDMIVIVRDRVRDLIGKGMTLDQVKAARPSRDYDTEYVSSNSFVSADRFVESVFTSLKKAPR